MLYPVVTLNSIQNFLANAEMEGSFTDPPQPLMRGTGDDFFIKYRSPLAALEEKIEKLMAQKSQRRDKDAVEGEISSELFKVLFRLPVEVLTDRDFWRFLSCSYFFRFTIWRDSDGSSLPSRAAFGAASRSIDMNCVPFRMFNRGLLCYEITKSVNHLDYALVAGTDVWRSHLLRVKTSYSPQMSREILEKLEQRTLPTDLVRPLAKRLRRLRSNVIFEALDSESASEIFKREYDLQSGLRSMSRESQEKTKKEKRKKTKK